MNPYPEWVNLGYIFDEFIFPRGATYHDPRGDGPHDNGPSGYPIFDYTDEADRNLTPEGLPLLDAGFAAGYEVIPISEKELVEMPEDEWHLLQRLISEPVAYPNTQIACSNIAAGNVVLTILHHVPCITTLEK